MASATYTTLLFDFDHTLFDSDASEAAAFDHTLRTHGVADPAAHFAAYRRINGALWGDVERGSLRPDDVGLLRFEQLVATVAIEADPPSMAESYLAALGACGDLYPGVRDVLGHLAERATLAIVTNAMSGVQRSRLARLELEHYFETIVISSEVGVSKPDRGIFDVAFHHLDHPDSQQVVMIGDSLTSDMRGGANAGIATCWFNPAKKVAGPDDRITHEIATIGELTGLVADDHTRQL